MLIKDITAIHLLDVIYHTDGNGQDNNFIECLEHCLNNHHLYQFHQQGIKPPKATGKKIMESALSPTKVEVMARSEKFFPPEASFILLMT